MPSCPLHHCFCIELFCLGCISPVRWDPVMFYDHYIYCPWETFPNFQLFLLSCDAVTLVAICCFSSWDSVHLFMLLMLWIPPRWIKYLPWIREWHIYIERFKTACTTQEKLILVYLNKISYRHYTIFRWKQNNFAF